METFTPKEFASCKHVLRQLKRLDIPTRQSFQSINLTRDLRWSDDYGNSIDNALHLANFLLAWKELEVITLPMPDDARASRGARDYDFFSWFLHRPLLNAFAQGRWRELRLLHPQRYSDSNVFLYHNICFYVGPWVLPSEARKQVKELRERFWHDYYATTLDRRQNVNEGSFAESERTLNASCERIWASRGITCQLEEPGPNENGTVIALRWREPWMREERQKANSTSQLCQGNKLPWQYWSDLCAPSFLQPLPEWKVVLCKTHENCFARDTLEHHLICHHGATNFDAFDVIFSSKTSDMAETWEDSLHPECQIAPIPGLPVIQGFCCADPSCMYCTVSRRDLYDHINEMDHEDRLGEECFLQTLSSRPGEICYF